MEKEKHKFIYYFNKIVLGCLFTLYYRPKAENRKVVPKKGPVIICGNHIHVYDQCIPMLKTPRIVHYMAKKEYFDSKFAWFFRVMNCISVNRSIHDEDAKEKALNVLGNGWALGIFPEGTRNQVSCKKDIEKRLYDFYKDEMDYKKFHKLMKFNQNRVSQINLLDDLLKSKKINKKFYKESIINTNKACCKLLNDGKITEDEYAESLLLPTKFGTVSMAQKTGATIIPYGITGDYKFRSKNLMVRFGKPMKVGPNEDLEKANKKLYKEIESLLKKNLKETNRTIEEEMNSHMEES